MSYAARPRAPVPLTFLLVAVVAARAASAQAGSPVSPAIRLPAPASVSLCDLGTQICVTARFPALADLRGFVDGSAAGAGDVELRIDLAAGRHLADPGLHLDGRALPKRIRRVTIAGSREGGGTQLVGSRPVQAVHDAGVTEPTGTLSAALPVSNYQPWQPGHLGTDDPGPIVPFDEAGPFELARWPRTGWASFTGDASASLVLKPGDPSRMPLWAGEPAAWVWGFLKYDWFSEHRGVATIDANSGTLVLADPTTYGVGAAGRFRLMNLRSEFDAPREYWIDAPSNRLHLRPAPGTPLSSLRIALATKPLVRLSHIRNLTLRDLVVGETRGHAILVDQGTDVTIAHVLVHDAGRSAVIVEGGENVAIVDAEIDGTGQHAVVLSGGDRKSLRASGHRIEGSRIHRASQVVMTPSAGVRLSGVGQIVRNNVIEDSPHMAVYFDGNDHRIEGNRISRVCTEVNDAGAIYAGRDWTFRGNVIRGNVLKDITRGDPREELNAIYLDDMLSGVTVERNVIINARRGVLIGGGRDNLVRGNVFVGVTTPVHIDQRALDWARASVAPEGTVAVRLRRMPYRGSVWRRAYPALAGIDGNSPAAPRGNIVTGNCESGSGAMDVVELARQFGLIEPLAVIDGGENTTPQTLAERCRMRAVQANR